MSRTTTALSSDQGPSTTPSTAPPAAAALTTPFTAPPSCDDIWIKTRGSFVATFATNHSKTTHLWVTITASNQADPRFAPCQPPGWDAGPTGATGTTTHDGILTFSPAVCPSGWTAWWLGHTYVPSVTGIGIFTTTTYRTISTANCCAPGFTFGYPGQTAGEALRGLGTFTTWPGCLQTITFTESYRGGHVKVHRSWHVSWEASDTTSMSPTPPELPCYDPTVTSWLPGETIPEQYCRPMPLPNDDEWNQSVAWFLIVGVPLLFVALVATACFVCCLCRRRRRQNSKDNAEQTKEEKLEQIHNEQPGLKELEKVLEPQRVHITQNEQEEIQQAQPVQEVQEKVEEKEQEETQETHQVQPVQKEQEKVR
ncbi:hypothetical protein RB601_008535 [Gaeumannomyces tritici]